VRIAGPDRRQRSSGMEDIEDLCIYDAPRALTPHLARVKALDNHMVDALRKKPRPLGTRAPLGSISEVNAVGGRRSSTSAGWLPPRRDVAVSLDGGRSGRLASPRMSRRARSRRALRRAVVEGGPPPERRAVMRRAGVQRITGLPRRVELGEVLDTGAPIGRSGRRRQRPCLRIMPACANPAARYDEIEV